MTQQIINVGFSANDGLGDPLRTAFIKCNQNFGELYSRAQGGPPLTPVGNPGDTPGMYASDENYFYYCYGNYDGSSIIWAQISQIANVVVTSLVSGSTDVTIPALNGNVVITVAGTANVVTVTSTGLSVAGNVTASLTTVTPPVTLASLTPVAGARAFINDGNLIASGNFGALVSGGGANTVPVWSNGTSWFVG